MPNSEFITWLLLAQSGRAILTITQSTQPGLFKKRTNAVHLHHQSAPD
jgi:hypothetical protein